MNTFVRTILFSVGMISIVQAQPGSGNGYSNVEYTYDLDIEMLGVQSTPVTISGTTTLSSSCSAAFCAGYGSVYFRNSIDGTYFTQVPSGVGIPPFYDPKDHDTLNFSPATFDWGTSGLVGDVVLTEPAGSKTVTFTCGEGGVSCPLETMTLIKTTYAPEMDLGSIGGAIALLLCGLAMGAGRRSTSSSRLHKPSRLDR